MVNTLNNKFLRFPWELSVFFIEKTGKLQLTPLVYFMGYDIIFSIKFAFYASTNFRMQNGMHQRVNMNAHKVVRINVKTWYGRISVKKNRSWLFNSSFWRERLVPNDDIWEETKKISCALYITSKVSKNPIFRAHNLKCLQILTW